MDECDRMQTEMANLMEQLDHVRQLNGRMKKENERLTQQVHRSQQGQMMTSRTPSPAQSSLSYRSQHEHTSQLLMRDREIDALREQLLQMSQRSRDVPVLQEKLANAEKNLRIINEQNERFREKTSNNQTPVSSTIASP